MKKAQGISINVIIIAAISLVVLVILIAVFTGRMSIFGIGLDATQRGATCSSDTLKVIPGSVCPADYPRQYLGMVKSCPEEETDPELAGCLKAGYICCSKAE
jgi:hypothetical protein